MKVSVHIPNPLAREYHDEVIKSIYWIDAQIADARYREGSNDVIEIQYDGDVFPETTRRETEQVAVSIIEAIQRSQVRTLFDQSHLSVPCADDPHAQLEARGELRPVIDGGYAYSGIVLELMNGLDKAFLTYARSLHCQEYAFPGLLSYATASRCGYLKSHPQNVNLVSHVREDLGSLRHFRDSGTDTQPAAAGDISTHLEAPEVILAPTICHNFWQSLADASHPLDELMIGTAVGPCYRFEGRATVGLERLRGFQMREVFAIGAPDDVIAFRDTLIEDQIEFLRRFCIAGTLETACDPFFVDDYSAKRLFQIGLDLKHEVRGILPYKRAPLAISSVNYHQNFFARSLNITAESESPVHSCCLGFGLDRWCLVILAQYGLDPTEWPTSLQELVLTQLEQHKVGD